MNNRQALSSADDSVARVVSAVALTSDEKATLAQKLHAILGHEVTLESVVDADVLGGLRVEVGEWVIDATVAHQLELLSKTLKEQL